MNISQLRWKARQRPDDAEAWYALAQALHADGRGEEARPAARRAAECVVHGSLGRRLGRLLLALGERPQAIRVWTAVLDADPGDAEALVSLSHLRLHTRDPAGAERLAEEVVARCPQRGDAHVALAEVRAAQGRLPEAAAHLADARRFGVAEAGVAARMRALASRLGGVEVPANVRRTDRRREPTGPLVTATRADEAPRRAPPVLHGALAGVPLGRLLAWVEATEATGTLRLPDAGAVVRVAEGKVVGAIARGGPRLGEVLRAAGAPLPAGAPADDDEALLALLVARGTPPQRVVQRALATQIGDTLTLLGQARGRFAFHPRPLEGLPAGWRQLQLPVALLPALPESPEQPGGGAVVARGRLGRAGLEPLRSLLDTASGVLRLVAPGGLAELWWSRGVVGGATTSATPRLGDLLVERGLLPRAVIEGAVSGEPAPLGKQLAGRVPALALRAALTDQVHRAVDEVAGWATGYWWFEHDPAGAAQRAPDDLTGGGGR
ncbi:MAG: tetratricopeptide repeat protein [Myxococcales bacterium]|nr:tetratricopeptide repeat protein [Myxococcales bacterium]